MARNVKSGSSDPDRHRGRVLRPYEWTHTDPHLLEWLHRQGLPDEGWTPPDWANGRR